MDHQQRLAILDRLDVLERLARSRSDEIDDTAGVEASRGRHSDRAPVADSHKIAETVVGLVREQVERIVRDQHAGPPCDAGGEREQRMIDLIVRLVAEDMTDVASASAPLAHGTARPKKHDRSVDHEAALRLVSERRSDD